MGKEIFLFSERENVYDTLIRVTPRAILDVH